MDIDWIDLVILAFVAGLGTEVKQLKAEIGRLKDELNQKNAS